VLTRLQAIEYLLSLSMDRRFKAELGILSIVPGAIGAYRRELLSNVGGLEPGPGCDSDATIRIRKLGRQIAFAQDAICRTTSPTSVFKLVKQRLRWDRNLVRNRARKHKDIFNPRYANFSLSSMISFADAFFFLALLPALWLFYTVDMFFNYPGDYDFILLTMLVLHYISMTFRTLTGLIVCQFEYRLVPLLLVLPIYPVYRLFLKLIRLTALSQEVFFRKSYQDPFAPAQVRAQMEVY
jgi:cellulose synthase/poly-beta-1,6-N-acetylglucosamine synthase-like glycosyltransferase